MEVPPPAARVALVRASTSTLEVCWTPTPAAQAYILEVQKIEQMPAPQPLAVSTPVAIVKKQPAIVSSPTAVTRQIDTKEHLISANVSPKTPIRSPAHSISFGTTTAQSILSPNANNQVQVQFRKTKSTKIILY